MITADTITDEQILELLDEAQYCEWRRTVADCYVALHGEKIPTRSRQHQRYTRTSEGYRAARARCAEILKDRAKGQCSSSPQTNEEG